MRTVDGPRVIARFRTTIVVHRKATGTYVNGRYVPAVGENVFTLSSVVVLPTEPKDLQLLPEGFRTKASLKVFAPELLRTGDAEAGQEADWFEFDGKGWEIHSVENWADRGLYWKAIGVKKGI